MRGGEPGRTRIRTSQQAGEHVAVPMKTKDNASLIHNTAYDARMGLVTVAADPSHDLLALAHAPPPWVRKPRIMLSSGGGQRRGDAGCEGEA